MPKAVKKTSSEPEIPPPPPPSDGVYDIKELTADRKVALSITRLTAEYKEASQGEKECKALKDALGLQLKRLMGENEIGKCIAGDFQVCYFSKAGRSYIDKTTLLERGVSPLIITAATKQGKSSNQLKITAVGQEEEEEE